MDLALFFIQFVAKMADPFAIAAGVVPSLAIKPWRRSLPAAVAAAVFVGLISALRAANLSFALAAYSLAATAAAALAWWGIALWGMRLVSKQRR
jgi:hypothetical protein